MRLERSHFRPSGARKLCGEQQFVARARPVRTGLDRRSLQFMGARRRKASSLVLQAQDSPRRISEGRRSLVGCSIASVVSAIAIGAILLGVLRSITSYGSALSRGESGRVPSLFRRRKRRLQAAPVREPPLPAKGLPGLGDGEQQGDELPGDGASGLGALVAVAGEHGFILPAIKPARRIDPPTSQEEQLTAEDGAAALRLALAGADRRAARLVREAQCRPERAPAAATRSPSACPAPR
jgi:hypothetical protein